MKKPRDTSTVPPGGWCYLCQDTGHLMCSAYYENLKRTVKEHFKANNIPIGINFNDQFDEGICAKNEPACYEFIPPTMMEKASMLTKSLVRWAASGFQVRTEEEVERIAGICRSCEYYGGENGFLRVMCNKCSCSKLKQWLKTSHCPLEKPKW